MPKCAMKFWIKERNNYQSIYFVAEGQLSKAEAKRKENPAHGANAMISYDTEEEYLAAQAKIIQEGGRFL